MDLDEYPSWNLRGKWRTFGEGSMAHCKLCGLEVQWAEVQGAYIPLDPDLHDHRESCAGMSASRRVTLRDNNHEKRVANFLAQKARERKPRSRPQQVTMFPRVDHICERRSSVQGEELKPGEKPPWED
jgi:hypothetical protein